MNILREKINILLESSGVSKVIVERIKNEKLNDPFFVEVNLLAYLLAERILSYSEYLGLVRDFSKRNYLPYINLFDLTPRTFGQMWGEQHIQNLFPEFVKATKENLVTKYPMFDGEFDLWLDGIRIEVKACRASNNSIKTDLKSRAYSHEDAIKANFRYHYQQIKPSCCDVFIWIGVCKDKLLYWVLSSDDVLKSGRLRSQHRIEERDIENSIFEGQVFMTEEELADFWVEEDAILDKVKEKAVKS